MIGHGKVISDGLTLHMVPGGQELDELAKGDELDILGERQGKQLEWLLVADCRTKKRGYVAAKYVEWQRNIDPITPIAPVPRPPMPPIPPKPQPSPATRMPEWQAVMGMVVAAAAILVIAVGLIYGWG